MATENTNKYFKNEPELSSNSIIVLQKRYLRKGENSMESPKDLFVMVAKNISEAEKKFNPNADCDSAGSRAGN